MTGHVSYSSLFFCVSRACYDCAAIATLESSDTFLVFLRHSGTSSHHKKEKTYLHLLPQRFSLCTDEAMGTCTAVSEKNKQFCAFAVSFTLPRKRHMPVEGQALLRLCGVRLHSEKSRCHRSRKFASRIAWWAGSASCREAARKGKASTGVATAHRWSAVTDADGANSRRGLFLFPADVRHRER